MSEVAELEPTVAVPEDANFDAREFADFDREMTALEKGEPTSDDPVKPEPSGKQATAPAPETGKTAGKPTDQPPKTDTPATAKADTAAPPKPGEKEPSKYAKELARQDKSWKALNAEKQAVAQERAQLLAQREEVARLKEQVDAAAAEKEATPEQLEAFAAKEEEEGRFDMAEAARKQAKALRDNPQKIGTVKAAQLKEAQRQSFSAAVKEFPSLADEKSPMRIELAKFLAENQELMQFPKAPAAAARYVGYKLAAARVPELETKVTGLESQIAALSKENAELKTATGLTGPGVPASGQGPKSFDQMSAVEQAAQLDREFRGG